MTTEASAITFTALPDTQQHRDDANTFLRRYHGTAEAIPSLEFESQVLARLEGLPQPVTVTASIGSTIIGAATSWVRIDSYEQLRGKVREDRALAWMRRWPLLTHIAVDDAHRREKVGSTLIRMVEQKVADNGARGLWGFAADLPAPSWPFYQALGYTIVAADEPVILGGVASMQTTGTRQGRHFYKLLHTPR